MAAKPLIAYAIIAVGVLIAMVWPLWRRRQVRREQRGRYHRIDLVSGRTGSGIAHSTSHEDALVPDQFIGNSRRYSDSGTP